MEAGRARRRRLGFAALPLVSTPVLYALLAWVAAARFHVRLEGPGWVRDLALQVALAYALLAISRRGWAFVATQALAMGTLYLGGAAKIAVWGWPPRPEELVALPELVRIVPPGYRLLVVAPLVLLLALAGLNFRARRSGLVAAAGVLALAGGIVWAPRTVVGLLDAGLEYSVWHQPANYVRRGATLYLLVELCRARAERPRPPTPEEVRAAARRLERDLPPPRASGASPPRSLYLVVLESFWDPSPLTAAGFDPEPLDPAFTALWERAGRSTALSGEFAGATANPELEILCGVPARVIVPGVAFKSALVRDLPCLPRLLAEAGWWTEAFHPNVPDFWNRSWAYRRLGFREFVSSLDLRMDDLNGRYLADASLYRQALRRLDGREPVLGYVLTITGHWPYDLAPSRPPVIACRSAVPEVCAYANVVRYTSRELATFVDEVLRRDPEALVVALGDHLPLLGESLAGYRESGVVSTTWLPSMTGEELLRLSSVPLLVVDGRRGPLPLGTVAQFELPRLILELLGRPVPGWLRWLSPPPGLHVRPFGSGFLVVPDRGEPVACLGEGSPPVCRQTARWLRDVRTIARDVVLGGGISLSLDGGR